MARRIVTTYYSDLSGAAITEAEAGVRFSLDGVEYEIDLTRLEQGKLRDALAPFTSVARELETRPRAEQLSGADIPGQPTPRAVRAWGEEHGFDVPRRGRVPELVREAYRAAHPPE